MLACVAAMSNGRDMPFVMGVKRTTDPVALKTLFDSRKARGTEG